ncbi:MAG TPA: gliding motility protein GldN [Chitinophagaceae bacterium]|nr:gliding motility protein GldN [Chitinophagaceae bacterium]
MRKQQVKWILLVAVSTGTMLSANAQRGGRNRNKPATDTSKPVQPTVINNNNQNPTNFNPYGNTPIEKAPVAGGFNDTIKRSLRNDAIYDKVSIKDRTPLPYENIRLDDALYTERVWREIDIREKMNMVFRYKAEDDNGDQRFINILVNAIRQGKVTAFDPVDDRFTTPLDSIHFESAMTGGNTCDTQPVFNLLDPTKIDKYVVNCDVLNPDAIVKFRIKEDWVFDRESSRMICRIIGIAPMKTLMSVDKKTERQAIPLFWVYYPDLRPTLVKYEVYNPKNMGQSRMTWEELFESRMFSSYIVKTTLDNPQNKFIRQFYPKDDQGILRLLEGDNIKDKIFNYEQDLWSY